VVDAGAGVVAGDAGQGQALGYASGNFAGSDFRARLAVLPGQVPTGARQAEAVPLAARQVVHGSFTFWVHCKVGVEELIHEVLDTVSFLREPILADGPYGRRGPRRR